jgi:hypothetical protein
MHALGIESYDRVNKEFSTNWYQSDGSRDSGTLTITGNTVIWAGPLEVGGKHYQFRETFVCTADFMSGTVWDARMILGGFFLHDIFDVFDSQ